MLTKEIQPVMKNEYHLKCVPERTNTGRVYRGKNHQVQVFREKSELQASSTRTG